MILRRLSVSWCFVSSIIKFAIVCAQLGKGRIVISLAEDCRSGFLSVTGRSHQVAAEIASECGHRSLSPGSPDGCRAGPGAASGPMAPSLSGAPWASWPAPGISGCSVFRQGCPWKWFLGGRTSCLTSDVSRRHLRGTARAHGETLPSCLWDAF